MLKINKFIQNQVGASRLVLVMILVGSLSTGIAGYAFTRISSAATNNIVVGTYNLRSQRWDGQNKKYASWADRKSKVKDVVTSSKADIVGMQEVIQRNPDTLKLSPQRGHVLDFMDKLGYKSFVGEVDNSSPVFWKKATFEKLTANSIEIYNPGTSQNKEDVPAARYLNFVRLKHIKTKKNIIVLNYHFNQWEKIQGQLDRLGDKVSDLQKKYPNDQIIFTGDFNNYEDKVRFELRNNDVKLHQAENYRGIDHVLVSKSISGLSWKNLGGTPKASDHPMIIAKLAI